MIQDIQFKQDTQLEVITDYNTIMGFIISSHNETFRKDEITPDVEIIDGVTPEYCDLQFGDGSVCYGVQRACFDVRMKSVWAKEGVILNEQPAF